MAKIKHPAFKLPKEFAEKWISELRTTSLSQGKGYLAQVKDLESRPEVLQKENCTFCCLGIATLVIGEEISKVIGEEVISPFFTNIPKELIGFADKEFPLIEILVKLNDGITRQQLIIFEKKYGVSFPNKEYPEKGEVFFTFPEIADFIEQNVTFY